MPARAPTCAALLHAGTGVTRLTASGPEVVRIKLHDDRGVSIGELEVDVDPHDADFRHTGALPSEVAGTLLPGVVTSKPYAWCTLFR